MSALAIAVRVARGPAAQRAALDAWLDARRARTDGRGLAVVAEGAFFELKCPDHVALARLAPGCVCCVGALPLRVTLTRLLRAQRPAELLLLVATGEHLARVRTMLREAQPEATIEVEENDETAPR